MSNARGGEYDCDTVLISFRIDRQTESNKSFNSRAPTGLTCIYVNARSVANKIDYLRSKVKVIDPDIVGVSES